MAGAHRAWPRRLAWLLALWAGGVAALGIVAAVLKLIMRGVGLA
ncbi:MAG: DUF2474 domain-containing protein [Pigmentiphaga sp.]|uniref:DUF2474 domain-containing protein n=1 Tax=Pigmentiphaga daeguensis TaxID=414049 RepID=A0ABP3M6J9_9BURK